MKSTQKILELLPPQLVHQHLHLTNSYHRIIIAKRKNNLHPSCYLLFFKRKSFSFRSDIPSYLMGYGLNKKRPEASQSKNSWSENLSKVNGLNFIQQQFDVQKMKTGVSHLIGKSCWFNNESGRRGGNFSMNINSLCKFSSRITDKSTISLLSVQIQRSPEFTRLRVVRQKGQD